MKKPDKTNIMLCLVFVIGLCLLLYPTFSDRWNSFHQSKAISTYSDEVNNMNAEKYAQIWENAADYNASLLERNNGYYLPESQRDEYEELLNVSGSGIMGYIEIKKINCTLPIYHGTEESVLQVGVGHLEWTSLPVGGESTHCVLSGHRGLPSARLFTDLDRLGEGDTFVLRILNETLTYEVDRILVVEPEDVEPLLIEEGMDYCTLVTCTPYGINSHRLLVRGHRTENAVTVNIVPDAVQIDPLLISAWISLPLLAVLLTAVVISDRRKRMKKVIGG